MGEKELQADYYRICKFLRKLTKEEGFESRMRKWDELCCGDRSGFSENCIDQRANTVPSVFQHLDDEDGSNNLAHEFIMNTGLLSGWASIPSLSDSDSNTSSNGTNSPEGMPPLLTQPKSVGL